MTLCGGNVPSEKGLSYLYPIQATQSSLAERSLKITSFDVYRKRHRFVGQVVVPLRDHLRLGADDLFDRKSIWRDLAAEELKCAAVGEKLKVE